MNVEEIKRKANECLTCKTKPCQVGCPLNNDITEFIKCIKEEKFEDAYHILSKTTVLESLCGRICPHEDQCQKMCVKAVSYTSVPIGDLEAYIGDLSLKEGWKDEVPSETKHHVAIVGAGPAGLTCAAFLRRNGIGVTIYEKHDYLGGLLVHGIPEFRLPKKLVKEVTDKIINLGINVNYNCELGKGITIDELEKKYDAVFIGIGANLSIKMNIPGEDLNGVFGANEFFEKKIELDFKDKTVIVSGGGNTAMDISRSIKKMGAKKVIVVYRRSEEEMPAEKKEIESAKKEEIEFLFMNNIISIQGQEKVEEIELAKTRLIQKEGESRLSPVIIEESNYKIPCDYVMMAIGSYADADILNSLNIDITKRGRIDTDGIGHTSKENIFAAGDVAGIKSTVAWAARSGRNAAYEIIKYLQK